MAKKKGRRPRPQARPVVVQPTSRGWIWWAAIGGVVLLGLVVIVVSRNNSGSSAPPDGVRTFAVSERSHTDQPVNYPQRPPVGGNHSGVWANCGIYDQPIKDENAVHALEHGAVWVAYKTSLAAADVTKLRNLVKAHYSGDQKYVILSPYPDLTVTAVSVQSWAHQLQTDDVNDPRIAQFIDYFKARSGDTPEPGAACTGGIGKPIG